jgi:DNA-binding CsgD family transcriptional regulator
VTESEALARLTPRERRCLELVARHYDTGQIAAELGISVATVNGYLADARQKLGARNRKEAARMLGAMPVSPAETATSGTPIEDRGMFERVEPTPPARPPSAPQVEKGSGGWLSRLLHLERTTEPHRFGAGGRTLMIVGLVVALCAALAMSVVAAVGLVSIFASLRP